VQRILKFSKFLPENGWQPIVIAPRDGTYPAIDESMMEEIPENCIVYRTNTLEPFTIYNTLKGNKNKKEMSVGMIGLQDESRLQKFSNYIRANYFIPDARKYWKGYVLKAAKKILKEHKIEAIITTGPPHSTHLAGLKLRKKFKIPWVADFRDPWTNIFYNNFLPRTERTKAKDLRLENAVVKGSDHLIVATPGLEREFEDRKEQITTILNGFDQADIAPSSKQKTEKFILAYVGNLLPTQSVNQLWEALEELVGDGFFTSANFMIKLTGKADDAVVHRLTTGVLKDVAEIEGYVPHKTATKRMQEAAMLLFLIPQDENNKLILTGKLFEYLATRRPILGIGPKDGDADYILQQSGRDAIIDYKHKALMKEKLLHYFEQWKTSHNVPHEYHESEQLFQFSRQQQTAKLATILNKITARKQN